MPRAKEKYGGVHSQSRSLRCWISIHFIVYTVLFWLPREIAVRASSKRLFKGKWKKEMLFITNEVNSTVSSKRAGNVRDFRSLSLGF